jgi:hypothetical protein
MIVLQKDLDKFVAHYERLRKNPNIVITEIVEDEGIVVFFYREPTVEIPRQPEQYIAFSRVGYEHVIDDSVNYTLG